MRDFPENWTSQKVVNNQTASSKNPNKTTIVAKIKTFNEMSINFDVCRSPFNPLVEIMIRLTFNILFFPPKKATVELFNWQFADNRDDDSPEIDSILVPLAYTAPSRHRHKRKKMLQLQFFCTYLLWAFNLYFCIYIVHNTLVFLLFLRARGNFIINVYYNSIISFLSSQLYMTHKRISAYGREKEKLRIIWVTKDLINIWLHNVWLI